MNTSSTSLNISWSPPPEQDQNGVITAYNITYVTNGRNVMVESTSGSTLSIELSGLVKFSAYNISVAASTSVGVGPSMFITITTDTDGEFKACNVSVAVNSFFSSQFLLLHKMYNIPTFPVPPFKLPGILPHRSMVYFSATSS